MKRKKKPIIYVEMETTERLCPKCQNLVHHVWWEDVNKIVPYSYKGYVTWHVQYGMCENCGYRWEISRWTNKISFIDKIMKWLYELINKG